MKNHQFYLRTRRVLLCFAVSLFTLAANAADPVIYVYKYPACESIGSLATNVKGYGGLLLKGTTSLGSDTFKPQDLTSTQQYYIYAADYANGGAKKAIYIPAWFIGIYGSIDDAKTKTNPIEMVQVTPNPALSGRKGGTDSDDADYETVAGAITQYWRTTEKLSGTYYAAYSMVKVSAVTDGSVTTVEGDVTMDNYAIAIGETTTLHATKHDGYAFKGWRVKGTTDYIDGAGADWEITAPSDPIEYEAVFGTEVVSGTYCHTQVNVYPTVDANLGTVALNTSSTVPGTFSTTGITAADNTESEGLYFFAKEANGYFLGFANGETAAQNGAYVSHSEADGIFSATGLELRGTSNSSDATADLNNVYAVFTMVKANKVSANGAEGLLSDDLSVVITNTTDNSVVSGAIGYGQSATLTATGMNNNYAFCGWRVAGTDAYVTTDITLNLTNVTEAVTYEAVFVYKREIYISPESAAKDANGDTKYWATVTNYNTDYCMVLPDELTVYSLRYGDELSTADFETSISPYTIDKVYATEAARTITLSGSSTAKVEMDLMSKVTYKESSNVGTSSSPNYRFKYSDGGWGDIPYSSANYYGGTNQASATNLQAALVCADAPGLYTVPSFTKHGGTSKPGEAQTWPRYNRLSGRDAIFAPSDLDSYDYYVLGNKSGVVAFYPIATGESIPARCAYIRVAKNGSDAAESIEFLPNNGSTPTGIETVSTEKPDANAPVYNLAGQRVDNNYKGIVIKNGNKYIRK